MAEDHKVSDDAALDFAETKTKHEQVDVKSLAAITALLHSQNSAGVQISPLKKVPVTFDQLTVSVQSSGTKYVKTLPRAILNTFGPDQYRFINSIIASKHGAQQGHVRNLLSNFSGVVRPGDMLLVLGRPGSGCSTFLRTVANRSRLRVTGDLRYAGESAEDFDKHHSRETIYLPEEDRHIASLTVRQTIHFALQLSVPKQNKTVSDINSLTEDIAAIVGLGHVLDTPVGGAFSPGVSGGERKRVSIAEVFAAGSSVQCFDNSTRGLDSSTALDFVKALRILTDIGQKTTLATLYQAGEELYSKFDKVVLIDAGREVFYGKTTDAKAYFERLGFIAIEGQTTAEFLTTVTDPHSRKAQVGSLASRIQSPDDLAAAFLKSPEYQQIKIEVAEVNKATGSNLALSTGTAFNLSYSRQILSCLLREYHLVFNQRLVYYTKWVTTLILVFACGSVYFDITTDAQGAFTRGGILFFALILNGWMQFPELFDAHTNRAVLERQAHLHLYRPSAVAVARFLIDLPLIAFQHVLFLVPFYFLTRLQADAGKFFFFYLTMYLSTINFSNLLRLFAYYVGTLDDTFRYGGFSCTVLLLFAGFLVPAKDMRPYFGWIHWINPMYYAFENLFTSEFSGLTIDCGAGNLVPAGNGYNDALHQTCTIPGSQLGRTSVAGSDYIEAYGFSHAHRWRNIGILVGIALAYLLAGAVGSEIMSFASQGGNPVVYKRSRKEKSPTKDLESSASVNSFSDSSVASEKRRIAVSNALTLTWEDLNVDIGEKHVLKNISGYVKRGQMTALCGASGAGKTTLLSALSQNNFYGQVHGEVLFENKPLDAIFRKASGFAQQSDLHDETATVREALEFSAMLRQPASFSKEEKLAHVEATLRALDLEPYADALIGNDDHGIGVEVLKRVTIAVELAARPEILFCDEPTSGLDSQGAAHIIGYLRRLSHEGNAILVTVHQPSALLFSQFDNLLALSSQGEQLYFGPVETALPYFERNGAVHEVGVNPASFILETVGAGIHARETSASSHWAETWKSSREASDLRTELHASKKSSTTDDGQQDLGQYNASIFTQSRLLTVRMLKNQWRNTPYVYSKIWVHVISAFLVGFTFYQVGTSPQDLQNRAFSVYFILFLCNAIVNVILARYFFASLLWQFREGPSKAYGWVAFVTSTIFSELPAAVLVTVLYYVIWFFPSGLPSSQAGYVFLMLLTYEIFQVLLGLFMMALSPDLGFAGNVLVFIVCTCNWFNGIIVPYDQIQTFWRYWLYYLNPFTYLLGGMIKAVNENVVVTCKPSDIAAFDPPIGQTCVQYAGSWAAEASAQILNPNSSTNCQVCKWTNGSQYLDGFNLGADGLLSSKWAFWGVFLAFTIVNAGLVYFFTYATKVKRWKLFYFF